jgi:hypothetical protein
MLPTDDFTPRVHHVLLAGQGFGGRIGMDMKDDPTGERWFDRHCLLARS